MKLCPNCKTIQKANTVCTLCKCPVGPPNPADAVSISEDNARRKQEAKTDSRTIDLWLESFPL